MAKQSTADLSMQQLSIPDSDVEDILVSLILDGKVQGKIDQVTQKLELDRQSVSFLEIDLR